MTTSPAAYGAAYLDEHRPGWAMGISLVDLDMADECRCVGGQLDGSFGEFMARAWPRRVITLRLYQAERYGFTVAGPFDSPADEHSAWGELQRDWIREVVRRQADHDLRTQEPVEGLA